MKQFSDRHIGPDEGQIVRMLEAVGVSSLDELIDKTIPSNIRLSQPPDIGAPYSEYAYLNHLKKIGGKNKEFRSYLGMGYYGTITPSVILRNLFQNPGWYTQYTPYQAEISQGRLESLLNFQTMVSDLTGLPIANASLLDEGTAAAEAMTMLFHHRNKKTTDRAFTILIDNQVFPQTVEVVKTRAIPLGIEVMRGDYQGFLPDENHFAVLLQYPNAAGAILDYRDLVERAHAAEVGVIVAADLLSLTLLTPPGEWGADIVIGNTQRFGVPMGFGGPHAAFFATQERFKRQIPGRIIGISVDAGGRPALRMALQTREQHIRREKATSNICTAQALLANMAAMYAVFHGPEGLRDIAQNIAMKTAGMRRSLELGHFQVNTSPVFDTVFIHANEQQIRWIRESAISKSINLWYGEDYVQFSLDETTSETDLLDLCEVFEVDWTPALDWEIEEWMRRSTSYLTHPVFNRHQTETKLMRYLKRLENKDLSLMHSMIPLGSCTMKLNAATQLIPVSWDCFAHVHPFVPEDQVDGYKHVIDELARDLCTITGFQACSFQPNSGAQGEFAGLMAIRGYHEANGQSQRIVSLIPSSAHGTNPASAVMAGMKVVIVNCDEQGNIDVEDLKTKAALNADTLGALMVTYPSTHGVFEESIIEICEIIHRYGGLVYMDGANMNAQVGLTNPSRIGADVCHLNLHKTFAIPHGGGGPGMGPICVNHKLTPFLAGHIYGPSDQLQSEGALASVPYGSASILLISHAYIKMLGTEGLVNSTKLAILNANYLQNRLSKFYPILYLGKNGFSAHEFILDLRPFKSTGIGAEDVAKRLMDYGFHAPTLSFPVPGTLMIEPTESEDKEELDRFCEAMISIKAEIDEIARGEYSVDNNVLINAPHPMEVIAADQWPHSYSREKAAFPLPYIWENGKCWPTVRRVDNAFGDRTLVCTCPPIEMYADESGS